MTGELQRWLDERSYHHMDFSDIEALLTRKREQGHSVSVCLPTLNVERTVGGILRVLRKELIERYPLIDQLAVVDSHSTDGTVEAVRAEGAELFFDDEILPGMGPASGKGEALWKSLFVLRGDIIVWIDSDIENIHPRFVYGLLGPLFEEEEIKYVKGFYRRPLKDGEQLMSSGGGRVTQLTVRPVLNLYYPELSGLIQPLSGEYAGRRSILEGIPFLTGYGVETGMLLEIHGRFGLKALAQVDLEVRRHYNQSLAALSKMSFAIMQALFQRLAADGKITLDQPPGSVYNMIRREGDRHVIEPLKIEVIERPPMRDIPEYRERGKAVR